MKITKDKLKNLIKESLSEIAVAGLTPSERDAALMQEAAGSLERLMIDAAKDAIAQGASKQELGQIMHDIMIKAGVNLDPRRNLLDPKTSDPDVQNVQKMANKASMAKMAKPEPLDDMFSDERDLRGGAGQVYESKKGEFGKMKITKSVLKDLIRETIEEQDDGMPPDVPTKPYNADRHRELIKEWRLHKKVWTSNSCGVAIRTKHELLKLTNDARADEKLKANPMHQKSIISQLRKQRKDVYATIQQKGCNR